MTSRTSDSVLIGIDAGTSVIKAVAFTPDGRQIAAAAVPNSYAAVADGGVEQDMARTWGDTATTLRQLAELVPNLAARTIAIAVTGQGDGMWLVDAVGEPVAPAWLWLDARSAVIVEQALGHPDYPAHYQRAGTGLNPCQMSAQLGWLAHHRPQVLARAATAFHCKDYLYFRLTGERATDPSEANFTFGDFRDRRYAPGILDVLGAGDARRLLPPIIDGTTTSHPLSAQAAAATGLKAGTPVTLGFVDVVCTGLGGGLFDPGGRSGCTIIGSTGMHMRLAASAAEVRLNPEMSGYTMAFPAPGMCAQMQSNMASTLNIDWLLDLAREVLAAEGVTRTRADLLSGLDGRVLARPPATLLFHPYISAAGERGPFMEPAARAMFTGLEIGHGFADLMRGVFEGLCFAARDCYGAMGAIPTEVRITGGAARSEALRLMLASTLNADIRVVARGEAGAAGAAMMAAVRHRLYPDMAACAAAWVDPWLGPPTAPDPALSATYDSAFVHYRDIRARLRPVWRAMATSRRKEPDAP